MTMKSFDVARSASTPRPACLSALAFERDFLANARRRGDFANLAGHDALAPFAAAPGLLQ